AVKLSLLKDAQFSVKNASRIHLFIGTQEMVAKIRLLDTDVLEPGQSGYALLHVDEKVAARNLDKFIIRFFSPMATIGGGVVLDMDSPKLKRADPNVIDRLDALNGTARERVGQIIEDAGCNLIKQDHMVITSGLTATEVSNSVVELIDLGKIVQINGGYVTRARLNRAWMHIEELLTKFHEDQSLAAGMHLGELRERVFAATPKTADAILEYFASQGKIRIGGGVVALADFETAFSPEQTAMQEKLDKLYASFPLEHPDNDEVAEQFKDDMKLYKQVLARMCQDGQLYAINSAVTIHKNTLNKALDVLYEMYEDAGEVTLGQFRDELGVSRKCAKMYLDYFDAQKITKMVGDSRLLLKKR
ncbi:MAG: SelB C-terminal domain-containing protein, partial [Oscillospiraceae bacterium]|nr:SelB C-terminal domain-containing protein [Oscillospiraceae bacterium]